MSASDLWMEGARPNGEEIAVLGRSEANEFGLTDRECRAAELLVAGASVEAAAKEVGVSRWNIRRMYDKPGFVCYKEELRVSVRDEVIDRIGELAVKAVPFRQCSSTPRRYIRGLGSRPLSRPAHSEPAFVRGSGARRFASRTRRYCETATRSATLVTSGR